VTDARTGYAVSADGVPLFYELTEPSGARRSILLCDGIGCDGYVWKYLREALADYRVIHWHYPGHGRSPAPADFAHLTIPQLADDAITVMEDCGVDQVVGVGHSMGVQVLLEAYRRHAHRLSALVLMCGAPAHPLRTFKGSALLESVVPYAQNAVAKAPRIFRRVGRHFFPSKLALALASRVEVNSELINHSDITPYLWGMGHIDPELFLALLRAAGEHSANDVLATVAIPTLVVGGMLDGFTPPQLSRRMAQTIPNAELLMVEDGSHTAPIERPETVNAAVLDFLNR